MAFQLNGAFCTGLRLLGLEGPVHGDMNLEPMMAYKFFEKFKQSASKHKIKLKLGVPFVEMRERNAEGVTLTNGQCFNPAYYDYYDLRYSDAEKFSAGGTWPVIWVKNGKLMGFVCPIGGKKSGNGK